MRYVVIALAALGLAACESEVERNARHDRMCQSYGAKPGSPEYVQCRATIHVAEVQQEEQDANTAMLTSLAVSASMNNSSASYRR